MDVSPVLKHFGISTTSAIHAVQQVRGYIEKDNDGVFSAIGLVDQLTNIRVDAGVFENRSVGTPDMWALHFAQAAVEKCIQSGCIVDNGQEVVDAAMARTEQFILKPSNKWMFAVEEAIVAAGGEVKAVSAQVDVKVEVKADGKIKKGGKETLAAALYHKYLADLNGEAYNNQAFIAILMRECSMSKAGATTYAYNMKKKFGGVVAPSK